MVESAVAFDISYKIKNCVRNLSEAT